jgi:hypothetical protein
VIPPFDERGNLPAGIHKADWSEVEVALGGSAWRAALLAGLREALGLLAGAGCRTAYLDGSFASAKSAPGDFDVCWAATEVDFDLLDPVFLDFSAGRLAQKMRFGGELFPAEAMADSAGTGFLEYFQRDRRTGQPKGILELDLKELP